MAEPQKTVPSSFVGTAEFQKAVMEAAAIAAASAVEQMRTELAASMAMGGSSPDRNMMKELAMHIAQLTDQGSTRKRVSPEILAGRAEAHERAIALILKIRKDDLKPEYQLVGKVYLNERFIEPFQKTPDKQVVRTEIIWTGMPNLSMRPKNDIARELYKEFRDSIGSVDHITSTDNRPLWMTAGGVVVKGDPTAQRREVAAPAPFADDLTVKTQDDPTVPFVHVLGTVAPPARQNFVEQRTP